MRVEITEQDILNLIDDICGRLNNTMAMACRQAVTVWDKLNILSFAVNIYKDNTTLDKETEASKRQIHTLQSKIEYLKKRAIGLEEENKTLQNSNFELKRELCTKSETIEEYLKKIESLNRIVLKLKKDMEPRTLSKNKHAYKKDVNPAEVFADVKCGMSITKAAKKYNVSRETIRKRCKEWEKELYGNAR